MTPCPIHFRPMPSRSGPAQSRHPDRLSPVDICDTANSIDGSGARHDHEWIWSLRESCPSCLHVEPTKSCCDHVKQSAENRRSQRAQNQVFKEQNGRSSFLTRRDQGTERRRFHNGSKTVRLAACVAHGPIVSFVLGVTRLL